MLLEKRQGPHAGNPQKVKSKWHPFGEVKNQRQLAVTLTNCSKLIGKAAQVAVFFIPAP